MDYRVLTLFPELFSHFSERGVFGRAVSAGVLSFSSTQLRDFAVNTQGAVDDAPYGGGSGMVLRPEPAVEAIEQAKALHPNAKVVLFTPRGRPLSQFLAANLVREAQTSEGGGFILLCSRYEGVDERVAEGWVDYEISLGDYVLMGGESAAMVFMETTARLFPGVLGNPESIEQESFTNSLLEHPHYTRPAEFRGKKVPEVLLSGNHAAVASWRDQESKEATKTRRPDLLSDVSTPGDGAELSVALIHHPVTNKAGEIITSSITNLDLHDIARSCKTFGVGKFYVVHPTKALRRLVEKIAEHWSVGYGLEYNPNRSEALELVKVVPDFDDVLLDIENRLGGLPEIVGTSARVTEETVPYDVFRRELRDDKKPRLLLLGTGWGIAPELMARCNRVLDPVHGAGEYNHLSVRAAAAIMLSRILGR